MTKTKRNKISDRKMGPGAILTPDDAHMVVLGMMVDHSKLMTHSRTLKHREATWLPKFRHEELSLGKLLEEGQFTQTLELTGITMTNVEQQKQCQNKARILFQLSCQQQRGGKPRYCVKQLKPTVSSDPRRFRQAARSLLVEAAYLNTPLNHPHIMKIVAMNHGEEQAYFNGCSDSYFMVVERMECTLFQRIEQWSVQMQKYPQMKRQTSYKSKAEWKFAMFAGRLNILHGVASALKYLHERHIILRDLSPQTIGFDLYGNVKLMDLSKAAEIHSDQGYVFTCFYPSHYMAPESRFNHEQSYKSDVFSLTVVAWECLTLKHCLVRLNENYLEEPEEHRNGAFQPNRPPVDLDWPFGVRSLIRRGWASDPSNRLCMDEFEARLKEEVGLLKEAAEEAEKERAMMKIARTASDPPSSAKWWWKRPIMSM